MSVVLSELLLSLSMVGETGLLLMYHWRRGAGREPLRLQFSLSLSPGEADTGGPHTLEWAAYVARDHDTDDVYSNGWVGIVFHMCAMHPPFWLGLRRRWRRSPPLWAAMMEVSRQAPDRS